MSIIILISWIVAALIAGGFAVITIGIAPAGATLDGPTWSALHRAFDRRLGPYFQVLLPIALATTAAVATASRIIPSLVIPSAVRVAFAVAGALFLAILVISVTVNVPINREVAAWTEPPADWAARRARWNAMHAVRTLAGFAAFVVMVAAPLLVR